MMLFLNGLAAGISGFSLGRESPILRVVFGNDGEFYVLDQPQDRIEDTEEILAYERVEATGTVHTNHEDDVGIFGHAMFPLTLYELVDPQPRDSVMRDTALWRKWLKGDI